MAVASKDAWPRRLSPVYWGPTPGYLDYLERYAPDDERADVLDSIYSISGLNEDLSFSSYRKRLSTLNLSRHHIEYYDTPSFIRQHVNRYKW